MSALIETFREATLLQCAFIEKLLELDMTDVAAFSDSMVEFLSPSPANKYIYGLAAGRSALALYSFLQLIQNHFDNVFPITLEDPVQRHFRKDRNLGLVVTGSGETPSVNKYIEDLICKGGEIRLITANDGGTAHKLVSEYNKGSILIIRARTKYATDKKIRSRLSPLGTQFELDVLVFLNALFKDIQSRLKGICESSCPEYQSTIRDFEANARLLTEIDSDHLEQWLGKLFPRSGRYMIGAVGRSSLVARAFEMRFSNMNKMSYWERDYSMPSFQIGDVYIPISGTGNTYEGLEWTMRALSKGADVMPITANRSSKLAALIRKYGRPSDIIFIPVKPEYSHLFEGDTSTTTWLMSDFTKFRYPVFEISSTVFTNSVVAAGAEFLGIVEAGMRRMHV
jgi:D-arabinose 5-phosphate isomerase GutQ